MSQANLIQAIQRHTLAVKQAIDSRTAPNSSKLENLTLAQILAQAQTAAENYTDASIYDLVEGNSLIEAVDEALVDLGVPVGGNVNVAIVEKSVQIDSDNVIAVRQANHFRKTVTGPTTFSVSEVPEAGRVCSFTLQITNGGSATVNWWNNIYWAEGASPILTAAGRDVIAFTTMDGGATWDGYLLGRDMKLAV